MIKINIKSNFNQNYMSKNKNIFESVLNKTFSITYIKSIRNRSKMSSNLNLKCPCDYPPFEIIQIRFDACHMLYTHDSFDSCVLQRFLLPFSAATSNLKVRYGLPFEFIVFFMWFAALKKN
jgi:hypothetical protein